MIILSSEKIIDTENKIEKKINHLEKEAITKACNLKALNIISNDVQTNYEIISKVLNTRIIDLKQISIELKNNINEVFLNIYEEGSADTSIKIKETDEISIKYNKKMRLFT